MGFSSNWYIISVIAHWTIKQFQDVFFYDYKAYMMLFGEFLPQMTGIRM